MSTKRVTTFASLVEGYQHSDPKLYQILTSLVQAVGELQAEVDPIVRTITDTTNTSAATPTSPTTIDYEILNQRILRIFWSGAVNAASYEVRKGTDWDTATFVTGTNQQEVRLDPIATGTHTYLVRAKNGIGVYAATIATQVITIPAIGSSSISAQVIDNFVLLRYTEPSSTWEISYYDIFKNGVLIGSVDSTFFVWFENIAGNYTYAIEAVDIVGNRGPRVSITAAVEQPADFELEDQRISLLAGTKVNALIYGEPIIGWDYTDSQGWITDDASTHYLWFAANTGKLLVCINTTETFANHFTTRTWDQPDDQIAAGYPIYIQPTQTTASYTETIDYGGVFNNVIVNLSWTLEQLSLSGSVSVASTLEFSTDGVIWSAPVSGPSAFSTAFRYLRITFNFTATNDKGLALFSNLQILLDVKREVDSGEVTALSTDVNGTTVTFNKPFKDVDSITVTPTKQVEPLEAIYEFVDVPNPTTFKVFVFDSTGNRITSLVSWKARGIV